MDDKGRLAVPSRLLPGFRQLAGLSEGESVEIVLCPTSRARLGVYPHKVFFQELERLEEPARQDRNIYKLRMAMVNYMDVQCLDKQNRFRIPSAFAKPLKLAGEVVVVGSDDKIEIVGEKSFEEQMQQDAQAMDEQLFALTDFLNRARGKN